MSAFSFFPWRFKDLNWANRITLFRIGAILPIVILIHFPTPLTCWLAALLFIAAAVSDFLDGYIARREGQVTHFGTFLDPLADKLLLCSVFIEMAGMGWVSSWIITLIVMRELAVTGLRAIAVDKGLVIAADRYGKAKTVLQIIAASALLIHYPFWGLPIHGLGIFILYIALLFTLLSGVHYFYQAYSGWAASREEGRAAPEK
jgi:CDP-diacylglycerol--glycerol-3-phosphate 3-phosphatidyltransferase